MVQQRHLGIHMVFTATGGTTKNKSNEDISSGNSLFWQYASSRCLTIIVSMAILLNPLLISCTVTVRHWFLSCNPSSPGGSWLRALVYSTFRNNQAALVHRHVNILLRLVLPKSQKHTYLYLSQSLTWITDPLLRWPRFRFRLPFLAKCLGFLRSPVITY